MFPNILLAEIVLLVLSVPLSAQQSQAKDPNESGSAPIRSGLPIDSDKLASALQGAYYHPDRLGGIDCSISVDWPALFSAMKMEAPAERVKILDGLRVKSHALRGKKPELTFDWGNGQLPSKETMESGFHDTVGGFYQIYWATFNMSVVSGKDIQRINQNSDGTKDIFISADNTKLVITVDSEDVPHRYTFQSPAMNGSINLEYLTPPNPQPGDLRRISKVRSTEQIGETKMVLAMAMDYQQVDSFYIPEHVVVELPGAYSIPLDFQSCSVIKSNSVSH